MSGLSREPLPLRVLIVEDEGLLAVQLERLVGEAGHQVSGWATSLDEAKDLIDATDADLVLVDVHLADGPTGVEVAEYVEERSSAHVVFMTANAKRIPSDFAGAMGVISKPYTQTGFMAALRYLSEGIRTPPPRSARPNVLTLCPALASRW